MLSVRLQTEQESIRLLQALDYDGANLVVIHHLNFLEHKDKSKNALINYLI